MTTANVKNSVMVELSKNTEDVAQDVWKPVWKGLTRDINRNVLVQVRTAMALKARSSI
jgi:hypothetical protein